MFFKTFIKAFLLLFVSCIMPQIACAQNFQIYDTHKGLSDNVVRNIMQLPSGEIAITTWGNINIFDGGHFWKPVKEERHCYKLARNSGIQVSDYDNHNMIWSKELEQLHCLDLKHRKYVANHDSLFRSLGITKKVEDVFIDYRHRLWFAAGGKVTMERSKQSIRIPKGYTSTDILDVETDGSYVCLFMKDGMAARCSLQNGKMKLQRIIELPEGVYTNIAVARSKGDGHIYILYIYNMVSRLLRYTPDTGNVTLLYEDTENHIWSFQLRGNYAYIPTHTYLVKYDLVNNRIASATDLSDTPAQYNGSNNVTVDNQGGIWMGTPFYGVLYWNPSFQKLHSSTLPFKHYQPQIEKRFTAKTLTDSKGNTWHATNNGLIVTIGGKTRKYFERDGLGNEYIHSILEDRSGNIWLSTAHGITKATLKHGKVSFANFDEHDGTLTCDYNPNEAALLKDGSIVMGGKLGTTLFNPNNLGTPKTKLTPRMVRAELFGDEIRTGKEYDGRVIMPEEMGYAKKMHLDYNQNTLSFVYSAMNYAAPAKTVYRYRLRGMSDVWTIVNHRSLLLDENGLLHLSFYHIPPGKYTLEVMASIEGNAFDGKIATLDIVVDDPWWSTPLAKVVYFVLLAIILYTAVKLYLKNQREKISQQVREDEMLKRIQDLLMQLKVQEEMHDEIYQKNLALQDYLTQQIETEQQDAPTLSAEPQQGETDSPTDSEEKAIADTASENPADNAFIQQAIALVEQHIGDGGYGVVELSRDLCMERTGLYKKLTAMMNESPSVFMRHIRMNRVAELVLQGEISVEQIAYKTGFSSPQYMRRCFQKEFGCTITEYIAKNK